MDDLATRLPDISGDGLDEGSRQLAIPLDDLGPDGLVLPLGAALPESVPESVPAGSISQGRALALSDFNPPDLSAGERLIRLAYRLGIPGSTLAAPFRKPLRPRLLALVESPVAGDRTAGMALRAGHFLIHGVKAPIGQIDFVPAAKLTAPFERAVHGFTWLRDLSASGTLPQCAPTAQRILAAWLDANGLPAHKIGHRATRGAAWRVENAGLRLLAWLVHAPLVLSNSDTAQRQQQLDTMAETARWLDRHVTNEDDRLAQVAGWCAITAAGLLLPEGKPRRLFGEAGLVRALGELVGDDGGVLSRSPLGQMEAIALLVDLSACYRAARRDPPRALETMLGLLVPPLLALTHSDGSLGNWQGAGAVKAERIAALISASNVRTRPLRDARQWGYQRVAARPAVLQFDTSPPPLARHARHGCASTLAFEFSYGEFRLISNCGGAGFAGGLVPTRIEQGLRGTAAHSALVLGDANSTAVLINGKLGAGVGEVEVDRRTITLERGQATRIEASHDGYVQRFGLIHRRILILRDDGSELRGEDLLMPAGRGKTGKVPFAIRFHLGPQVTLHLHDNGLLADTGKGATLVLPDGSHWQFITGAEKLEAEESLWVDGDGRPHAVEQLVIQVLVSRGGGNFGWLLKKMG